MNKQKDRCEGRTSDLDAKVLKEKLPTMPLFCIKYGPRGGFNFTLPGALLPGAGFEPTSFHGHKV